MKPIHKKIALATIVVLIVGIIIYLEAIKPHQGLAPTVLQTLQEASSSPAAATGTPVHSSTVLSAPATPGVGTPLTPAQFLASRANIVKTEQKKYQSVPELAGSGGFINAQPFKLSDFVGKKVVLVDFWTYSCINCIRTLPYLTAWYQKYKDDGFVIVGVHTPEFDFEHNYANVQAAVQKLGVQYPVVLDNDMGTWTAYQNLYWPHEYLINIDGFIVDDNIGEGNYNETERAIQAALADRAIALGIPSPVTGTAMTVPTDTMSVDYSGIQSPETYFGAERNGYLANGPAMTNGTYTLVAPSSTTANKLYLSGMWDFEDQYAQNKTADAKILYQYQAKNVYMVASAATPITLKITLDGKPLGTAAGSDVAADGTITIQANRLYNLINGAAYGEHTLEITVQSPGLQAYTFTFG